MKPFYSLSFSASRVAHFVDQKQPLRSFLPEEGCSFSKCPRLGLYILLANAFQHFCWPQAEQITLTAARTGAGVTDRDQKQFQGERVFPALRLPRVQLLWLTLFLWIMQYLHDRAWSTVLYRPACMYSHTIERASPRQQLKADLWWHFC